jgi:hypothetical protein
LIYIIFLLELNKNTLKFNQTTFLLIIGDFSI